MIGLRLENVSKRFTAPGGVTVNALDKLSLAVRPGEFVVVVGPNGSGKSTLLNLIAGAEHCDKGGIVAVLSDRNEDWTQVSKRQRSRYVSRIHQHPSIGSTEDLTVGEHIRLACLTGLPHPLLSAQRKQTKMVIEEMLQGTALAGKVDALVGELSYGQRQLLALEMAAARDAQIFLLDEPTASLDRGNVALCMERVFELGQRLRATLILVTHDMALAAEFGDRLIVLRNGRLHADIQGATKTGLTPEKVFQLCGFDEAVVAATSRKDLRTSCSSTGVIECHFRVSPRRP